MCETEYDMTYTDLNPKFLFSFIQETAEGNTSHSHDFAELVVILKGNGTFEIDGIRYEVEAGNVVLLNPGTNHCSCRKADSAEPFVECYLGFTDVEFKNCVKGCLPLFPGHQVIARLPDHLKGQVFRLCRAMEAESNQCETGRYFMLKAYLIQILCLLGRMQQTNTESVLEKPKQYQFTSLNKKYIVRKITEYLELHYQEKISLDQVAANMYLSSYYISKIFKSETGDTPINYLISLRMKKARELLDAKPELPIQSVAAAVGYEDAYHFSKLFKKFYGLSPLYYKGRL